MEAQIQKIYIFYLIKLFQNHTTATENLKERNKQQQQQQKTSQNTPNQFGGGGDRGEGECLEDI